MSPSVAVPRHWYNAAADIPELFEPYVDPVTGRADDGAALGDLFAPELVEQEMDRTTRMRPIPEEVLARYALWRPTPLLRAVGLERALGTRCRILYKYEGVSPIGSHKANSGVAQAHYSKRGGIKRLFAETGAGQWGSAISMGSAFTDLDCEVFMVGNSYDAKPGRRIMMETYGSTVHRSPSPLTAVGREAAAQDPDSPGSLGLAIGEAVEAARSDPRAGYALGSAFNFVCLHQTVIGQELRAQLDALGLRPDALVSCIGGGSSYAGLVFPFLDMVQDGGRPLDLLAVESNAVPKVTQGRFAYDHGDSAKLTPLTRMYTLGHEFSPPGIHSGGLRYHGLAGQVSQLIHLGLGRAVAYSQLKVFEAAALFARTEGLVAAPEAAHSIAAVCDLARTHRDEERTFVFCLTGHGLFDLPSYERFNLGRMEDSDPPSAAIERSLRTLPAPSAAADSPGPRQGAAGDPFDAWQRRHFGPEAGAGQSGPAHAAAAGATAAGGENCGCGSAAAQVTDGSVDLTSYQVVSERIVATACADGPGDLVIAERAVLTPAAEAEARNQGRRIVRGRPAGRPQA